MTLAAPPHARPDGAIRGASAHGDGCSFPPLLVVLQAVRPVPLFRDQPKTDMPATSDPQLSRRSDMVSKNTICLWYDRTAEDAAKFYAATFPDSKVGAFTAPLPTIQRQEGRCPHGRVHRGWRPLHRPQRRTVVQAQRGVLVPDRDRRSGRDRPPVECDRQERRPESACGWCKDKWGSRGRSPRALTDGMADPDPAVNKRVFEAMMEMKKIDVAAIEKARRG